MPGVVRHQFHDLADTFGEIVQVLMTSNRLERVFLRPRGWQPATGSRGNALGRLQRGDRVVGPSQNPSERRSRGWPASGLGSQPNQTTHFDRRRRDVPALPQLTSRGTVAERKKDSPKVGFFLAITPDTKLARSSDHLGLNKCLRGTLFGYEASRQLWHQIGSCTMIVLSLALSR